MFVNEIPFFSIIFFELLKPAVSKNLTNFPFNKILVSIRSLVVPGILETMDTCLLAKQLIKDDLPELVGPTIETLNPSLIFSEFSPFRIISLILSFIFNNLSLLFKKTLSPTSSSEKSMTAS